MNKLPYDQLSGGGQLAVGGGVELDLPPGGLVPDQRHGCRLLGH